MKNKAPLPLMEQLIMILVFALTAALCLQGFSLADRISRRQQARQEAVILAQNTAELLKYTHGDYDSIAAQQNGEWDEQCLTIFYDGDKQLHIIPQETTSPFLGSAQIRVTHLEDILFELTVSWQEVTDYESP